MDLLGNHFGFLEAAFLHQCVEIVHQRRDFLIDGRFASLLGSHFCANGIVLQIEVDLCAIRFDVLLLLGDRSVDHHAQRAFGLFVHIRAVDTPSQSLELIKCIQRSSCFGLFGLR